jgi:hypothetical protein
MTNPKVATIVPIAHLDEIKNDDYFMALSYAVDNAEYAKFFRDRSEEGKYVILDNSAVELGEPEPFETYLDKAMEIKASEIMLPDIFQDGPSTLVEACRCAKLLKPCHKFDLMVIPQVHDHDEWVDHSKSITSWLDNAKSLTRSILPFTRWLKSNLTIGISARYTDMFGNNRSKALLMMPVFDLNVHFLGCYADPTYEIRPNINYSFIRGVDSSYPSVYAKNSMALTPEVMSMPRPMTKIDLINDRYEPTLIHDNVRAWRDACLKSR